MKPSIILSLIVAVSCIMVSPASAGTWSDGFEDGKHEDWQITSQVGPTTVKEEEGVLSMEVHSEFISYLHVIDSDWWQDYTLTVRVKIMKTFGKYVDGGIEIRYTDSNNYYFFVADDWTQVYPGVPPECEGAFVFPWINEQVQKGQAKVFTPELDHWYTLKAIAQGDHTEFYINGDLVGEFDYGEIKSGSVGLVVSNALVHFDDFVVTGPDIPDGGPGGASISVRRKDELVTTWGTLKQKR